MPWEKTTILQEGLCILHAHALNRKRNCAFFPSVVKTSPVNGLNYHGTAWNLVKTDSLHHPGGIGGNAADHTDQIQTRRNSQILPPVMVDTI